MRMLVFLGLIWIVLNSKDWSGTLDRERLTLYLFIRLTDLPEIKRIFYFLIELFEKYNVTFISTTQSFDTSSAAGKLMKNIMSGFAQFEREMTVERIKGKMLARVRNGLWNGSLWEQNLCEPSKWLQN